MKEQISILSCILLLTMGISLATIPRWFEVPGVNDSIVDKCYFVGQAASFTCFIIIAIILCTNKILGVYLTYALMLSASNLCNELFGDPLHWHINDILIGCIGLIYTNYIILKSFLTKIKNRNKNVYSNLSGTTD